VPVRGFLAEALSFFVRIGRDRNACYKNANSEGKI
jgi:hypothetical protein